MKIECGPLRARRCLPGVVFLSFSISLLGAFQVTLDDQPAAFATDRARALLAYLAVEADRPHRREALAGLLWPDRPEATARQNLSQSLARVRRAIDDHRADPPFLLISRKTIRFNAATAELDVARFEALLASCAAHPRADLSSRPSCVERLEAAASLYRGGFLQGLFLSGSQPFEEWALFKREQLHRQALELFYRLTAHFTQQAAYEQAEHYARRQLELEPWREEAHASLMQILALSGRTHAALAQFEICSRLLAEELGVAPSVATVHLFEHIRSGQMGSSAGPLSVETSLSSPRMPRHNLPPQTMPFVGRREELARLSSWLGDPECRLVTLLGPGGIGKTRLALEAARSQLDKFHDGVRFVPLAALEQPEEQQGVNPIVAALVEALKLSLRGDAPVQEQLLAFLEARELLLVLDNVEPLLSHTDVMDAILRRAPRVKMLVTSLERLNLQEEWLFFLGGMRVPEKEVPAAELGEYDAVQLFVRGAKRVRPDFDLAAEASCVVHICQQVGGMPLAIELAAAWMRLMQCPAIAAEIAEDLDFLAGELRDVPPRHRSLRAVFDHSWRLLSEPEQAVMRQLAVFRGGFEREAAEAVTGASLTLLAALVDKSLLQVCSGGRYQMHPLLHQYAEARLRQVPAECEQARDRHCHLYLDLLRKQDAPMKGGGFREAQQAIRADLDNVRAAWRWALEREHIEQLRPALLSLFFFYSDEGRYLEGEESFRRLVIRLRSRSAGQIPGAPEPERDALLGLGLTYQGWFVMRRGRLEEARALFANSLTCFQPSAGSAQRERAYASVAYGNALLLMGEPAGAKAALEESLRWGKDLGDVWLSGASLSALGNVRLAMGRLGEAERYLQESIAVLTSIGNQLIVGYSISALGHIAQTRGHLPQANQLYLKCLQLRTDMGSRTSIALTLCDLGEVARLRGEFSQAHEYYRRSLALGEEIGLRAVQAEALRGFGNLRVKQEQYAEARAFFQRSLEISQVSGLWAHSPSVLTGLGWAALGLGSCADARQYFLEALERESDTRRRPILLDALAGLACCLAGGGEEAEALGLARLILEHPAATHETRERALSLEAELLEELAQETIAAAQAHAEGRTLERVVEEILSGNDRDHVQHSQSQHLIAVHGHLLPR
jgi:predicted ATPase/DNA-binding SARP family transcriptional activator/Tfp pilus assembly protein PilF